MVNLQKQGWQNELYLKDPMWAHLITLYCCYENNTYLKDDKGQCREIPHEKKRKKNKFG